MTEEPLLGAKIKPGKSPQIGGEIKPEIKNPADGGEKL